MKEYAADKIRNVALIGHGSSGKTSLASAFLFNVGVTTRLTRVDAGNTVTDYDPDEIERQISINSSLCHVEWKNHKINLIDCPGYTNFLWDTRASLRAVDAGAVVICSVAGVEVGTEKGWEMLNDLKLPRVIIVNKLDRENSDFDRTVAGIHEFFGRNAVPIQLPIGKEKDFIGVVDLISQKAYLFEDGDSGKMKEADVPADMKDVVQKKIEELTEMVAENDEQLMEKYFESGELTTEELINGLSKSILNRDFFPIFVTSSLGNIATQPLLDGFVKFLPSPDKREEIPVETGTVSNDENSPFTALVFKTISDPYTGRISLMRIFSGKVKADSTVQNSTKETNEKFVGLFFMQGKEQVPTAEAKAGDLVATAKLKETSTGDTLCAKGSDVTFASIKFPEPSISFAIEPKTR
ncbi:GTP-binding protein, partial [Acidobacteriota bacterium]